MPTLILNEKVGADGRLHLDVELPAAAREGDVEIVMTWRQNEEVPRSLEDLAGSIQDPTFIEADDLRLQDNREPFQ